MNTRDRRSGRRRHLLVLSAILVIALVVAVVAIGGSLTNRSGTAEQVPNRTTEAPTVESSAPAGRGSPKSSPSKPKSSSPKPSAKSTTAKPMAPARQPKSPLSKNATSSHIQAALDKTTDVVNAAKPIKTAKGIGKGYLAALNAQRQEFDTNHWKQVGAAKFSGLTVVESKPKASPPTVVVEVCVDSSNVKVLDSKGVNLRAGNSNLRSLNLFTLQRRHGHWIVAGQSFPDNPTC